MPNEKQTTKETQSTEKTKPRNIIDELLKILTLAAAETSLLGYGVVIGLSSATHIDHSSILSSPFDLLNLVWPGVLLLVTSSTGLELSIIFREAFLQTLPIAGIIFLAVVVTAGILRFRLNKPHINQQWFRQKALELKTDSVKKIFFKATIVSGFSLTISVIATVLSFVAMHAIAIALLITPIFGFMAGQAYFSKYVLSPSNCKKIKQIKSQQGKNTKEASSDGATCVLITSIDPTKPYTKYGRVVLTSSSYMLIYHTDSGIGERIPISGLALSSIDDDGITALKNQAELHTNQNYQTRKSSTQ